MLEALLEGVSGWGGGGAEEAQESRRKTQTETAEEESELLVIISIPVDMKYYPNCGKLRKATVTSKRSSRSNSDVQMLENSEGVDLRYGNILNLNQIPRTF